MRHLILVLGVLLLLPAPHLRADPNTIVFTASQGTTSRIYYLDLTGAEITHHEYEYYLLCDVEILAGELYVVDWVAPCLYRVDPLTGGLEQIVNDLSLLYLYDVASDGSYFYLNEWSLLRYSLEGTYVDSASLGPSVRGAAWDGTRYWTLSTDGHIQCWDLEGWPNVVEEPTHAFDPPSTLCRGLWFDGQCFWSAEHVDGAPGAIYRFDHQGGIVASWPAPAYEGYAAGLLEVDWPTPTPAPPTPSPTPTATTPTRSPTPSPSPTTIPTIPPAGMELLMDDTLLEPGDRLHLYYRLHNPGPDAYRADAWVLLDVYGDYWCYPSWIFLEEGMDFLPDVPVDAGTSRTEEVLDFSWPSDAGSIPGVRFFGAAFRAGSFEWIGQLQVVNWEAR